MVYPARSSSAARVVGGPMRCAEPDRATALKGAGGERGSGERDDGVNGQAAEKPSTKAVWCWRSKYLANASAEPKE